jgi:tetratricopeptide (TPR) repeat protein
MGVTLLESNHTAGAIYAFQEAALVMTTFTYRYLLKDVHSIMSVPYCTIIPSAIKKSLCNINALHAGAMLVGLSHCEYYVYKRPLILPQHLSFTLSDEFDLHILKSSAILIFNVGIACHQFGNQNCGAAALRQAALRQAAQLYEITIQMILQARMNDNFLLIFLGITLNNLAIIHYELCDYDTCTRYFEYIRNLFARATNFDTIALEYLHEVEWSDLQLNLTFIQSPSVPVAQAA